MVDPDLPIARRWPMILWPFLLALTIGAGLLLWRQSQRPDTPTWLTARISLGPIRAGVSASGTLNPEAAVAVSSQVSGQIRDILVDFNSEVRQGQRIAQIDPASFLHRVDQARADLQAAQAQALAMQAAIAVADAGIARAQATHAEARLDRERKQSLVNQGFLSPAELGKAQAIEAVAREDLRAASAQIRVANAQQANAQALVAQRQAQLAQAEVDLARTTIRAPVDGIVIRRSVDAGQTVAASLQAPELFLIARDLRRMQVETAVDEAEIGRVRTGQKASFTVDAYPGRSFAGEVRQIRKAAQTLQNVVSYTVVVSARNEDLALLPGMTANLRLETDHRDAVLRVPNAALRFQPEGTGGTPPRIWIPAGNGQARAVSVRTGLSDGKFTEISGEGLDDGDVVIVGNALNRAGSSVRGKAAGPPHPPF